MTKQKDMKLTNWLMCILAIAAVVLSVLIYLKVNKKCERQKYTPSNMRRIRPRGRKVGFDILPSNPFTVGNMSPDMVALCNQSQLNSNQYFCDNIYDASQGTTQGANTVDPTDNDLFCVGNAALANDPTDGSTVYIGMCSKPITYGGDLQGPSICCDPTTTACSDYGIATNSCNGQPCVQAGGDVLPGIGSC